MILDRYCDMNCASIDHEWCLLSAREDTRLQLKGATLSSLEVPVNLEYFLAARVLVLKKGPGPRWEKSYSLEKREGVLQLVVKRGAGEVRTEFGDSIHLGGFNFVYSDSVPDCIDQFEVVFTLECTGGEFSVPRLYLHLGEQEGY